MQGSLFNSTSRTSSGSIFGGQGRAGSVAALAGVDQRGVLERLLQMPEVQQALAAEGHKTLDQFAADHGIDVGAIRAALGR